MPVRTLQASPSTNPLSPIWGSFDLGTPSKSTGGAAGVDPRTADFFGGGTLDVGTPAAPIDPRTLPNPNNPGGISDMELANRTRILNDTATTTANINLLNRDATGGASYDPDAMAAAHASGNIGGASGAYNLATDSGKAQYDYMHDLGSPDLISTPSTLLNDMGERVGISHVGDAINPLDSFRIGDPTNPLGGLKRTLNQVIDPDTGLGTTLVSSGGASGGKPISNLSPGTRAAANAFIDTDLGDMGVTNVMGLDLPGAGGGGGGGGGGSGTTLDGGRGISLPDQLVYARGSLNDTKDLGAAIRNGEFAPPSDIRQKQLDSIAAADKFAAAATGPGMGSFLSAPPSPSGSTLLKQPATGLPAGAQPQPATMPANSGPTFGLQTTGSPLGPAATAAAAQPLQIKGDFTRTPMPTTSAFPTGDRPMINASTPPSNPIFAPGNFAPPTPAAPPGGDPLRATLGARQDVGSYLTGSRATDPWSAQVQGFLQAPEGPSAAQAQLTQARDASMADALSMARSGRGTPGQQARALRGAMSQNAATMGQANQQAALLRANEAANYKQQQLAGLGLGANIAAGKDQNTLGALNLSGNLAQGIDQDTLAAQTLSANTSQGTRGLDITEAGQTLSGVLDADKIAAGREGDLLNAATSAYATDRNIAAKPEETGPGDLKYWTDKI